MQIKWYFDKFARPFLKDSITLSKLELDQIDEFTDRLVDEKMKQTRFLTQKRTTVKNSFYNGYLGEVATENFLGTKFIHWKIREEKELDISDLSYLGINVGIKTAEFGNLPLVYHYPKTPEIITIIEKPKTVYIFGYATIPVLKYYQSSNYAFGDVVRIKGGFWGFHKLHEFKSIDDLRMIYNDKNLNFQNNFYDTPKDFTKKDSSLVCWDF